MDQSIDFQPMQQNNPTGSGQQSIDFQPIGNTSNNTQNLVTPGNLPMSQMENVLPGNNQTVNSIVNRAAVNPITAATAGVAEAGAGAIETGVNAAGWVGQHMGLISPETAQNFKTKTNDFLNKYARSDTPDSANDMFTQSAQQFPEYFNATKYGVGAGLIAGATVPNAVEGMGAIGAIGNSALRAAGNALEGIGLSGPDDKTQTYSGIVAGVLSPIMDGIAQGAISLSNKLQLTQSIKDILEPLSSKIIQQSNVPIQEQALQSEAIYTQAQLELQKQNYNVIKNIPGTINTKPLVNQINNILTKSGSSVDSTTGILNHTTSTLENNQLNFLSSLKEDIGNTKNMEDALNLKQDINSGYQLFSGPGSKTPLVNAYKSLQSQVKDEIGKTVQTAGLTNALKIADQHHEFVIKPLQDSGAVSRMTAVNQNMQRMQYDPQAPISPDYTKATNQILPKNMTPQLLQQRLSQMDPAGSQVIQNYFIQKTFKDALANPENFNPNKALMSLNSTLDQYKNVLSPETKETFKGIQTVLQQAGAVAKSQGMKSDSYFMHTVGGLLGGELGYHMGGEFTAGIGAAAGIGIVPPMLRALKTFSTGLLETNTGQTMLKSVAGNPQAARQILQLLNQSLPTHLGNSQEDENVPGLLNAR